MRMLLVPLLLVSLTAGAAPRRVRLSLADEGGVGTEGLRALETALRERLAAMGRVVTNANDGEVLELSVAANCAPNASAGGIVCRPEARGFWRTTAKRSRPISGSARTFGLETGKVLAKALREPVKTLDLEGAKSAPERTGTGAGQRVVLHVEAQEGATTDDVQALEAAFAMALARKGHIVTDKGEERVVVACAASCGKAPNKVPVCKAKASLEWFDRDGRPLLPAQALAETGAHLSDVASARSRAIMQLVVRARLSPTP